MLRQRRGNSSPAIQFIRERLRQEPSWRSLRDDVRCGDAMERSVLLKPHFETAVPRGDPDVIEHFDFATRRRSVNECTASTRG